jgi:hypothetical protein
MTDPGCERRNTVHVRTLRFIVDEQAPDVGDVKIVKKMTYPMTLKM